MSRNVSRIVMHHSLTPRDLALEKSIQSFNNSHKTRLHPDVNSLGYHIAYHWIVAGDGSYRRTRADHEIGYHASNRKVNSESIGICLTGNFDIEHPTQAQYETAKMLINKYPGATIHGHKEFAPKTCPGNNFNFDEILMLFYEKLRRDNFAKIDQEDRMFKDPDAFIERTKDLPIEKKLSEMTFLIAILAEKVHNTTK